MSERGIHAWRNTPLRSLEDYLAELQAQFDALPMTSPARGPLANRIVQVEAEIDAREPL